jgi:hypothetical protein
MLVGCLIRVVGVVSIEETVGISSTPKRSRFLSIHYFASARGTRAGFYTFATHTHFPAFLQDASCGTPAPKGPVEKTAKLSRQFAGS